MSAPSPAEFVRLVRDVIGDAPQVGLHVPDIGDEEKRVVADCLDSTFVSSVGAYVTRFEEEIAAYTGAAAAVAVSNGTVALQVALQLAGVEAGDEVLVPTLSFIATANAVHHVGAHPVFLDSEHDTLGLSPDALRGFLAKTHRSEGTIRNPVTGRRVAAVVPMHTLGHPVRIAEIVRIAHEWGLPVVEDAAESLGSFVDGRHTGTFGRLGILSFNGNKILTTGGGGMILTGDADLARRARHLTTTAKLPHRWEFAHDEAGYNYRMPNINAALGVAQFGRLPRFLDEKRLLAERYREAFDGVEGVRFLAEPAGTRSNHWLCAVEVDGGRDARDAYLAATNDDGIQTRPFWGLLHEQLPYRAEHAEPTPVAQSLYDSVVCLPSTPALVRR